MVGLRMSARSHVTLWAQEGGVGEAVTDDQVGSPERLQLFQHMKHVSLPK